MFTGLIETVGRVSELTPAERGLKLRVEAQPIMADLAVGDSIAVNGVCLTAVVTESSSFTVEAVPETLNRTNLGALTLGDAVNLERALQVGQRLGGHFVQGHVDGTAKILSFEASGDMHWLKLLLPDDLKRYVILKGSIAVDGISLTIADKSPDSVGLAIIPHTLSCTTLAHKQAGDPVNIEVDMMAKYVESFLAPASATHTRITVEMLKEHGFA